MVNLLCRDSAFPQKPLFTPCIAIRAAGRTRMTPSSRLVENNKTTENTGLSTGESVGIGLTVTFLLATYITASAFYVRARWKKKNSQLSSLIVAENGKAKPTNLKSTKKNASKDSYATSLSSPISSAAVELEEFEDLSVRRAGRKHKNGLPRRTKVVIHDDDSIYSEASFEEEMDGRKQRIERMRMELKIDRTYENTNVSTAERRVEKGLVKFGLPIIEASDIANETALRDASEITLSDNSGQGRRKLYFNSSYFDLTQLQSPPAGAVEFLDKMREMIASAKIKMKSKSFQPSLGAIPEDLEYKTSCSSKASSTISTADSNSTVKLEDYSNDKSEALQCGIGERKLGKCSQDENSKNKKKFDVKRGSGLVNEIIQTIDLKPRFPSNVFPPARKKAAAPNCPSAHSGIKNPSGMDNGTVFQDLVKPSMFKRAVNAESVKSTDHTNSFDSFRHEMLSTLNKVRKIGDSISPISSLKRNKSIADILSSESTDAQDWCMNDKVKEWLKSLESKCKTGIIQNDPVTSENNRSNASKNCNLVSNDRKDNAYDDTNYCINKNKFKNSKDSASQEREYIQYISETDSLRHIIKQANEKLPKMVDVDLCTYDNLVKSCSSTLSKYDKVCNSVNRECQARGLIEMTKEETCIQMASDIRSSAESDLFGNPIHSRQDEHSYEEIQFSSSPLTPNNPNLCKEHIKEIQVPAEDTDDEGRCSIYSNPESMISEIHIQGEEKKTKPVGNVLSIEIHETCSSDSNDDIVIENKRRSRRKKIKIKRNDSILQDSLERPKVKKKLTRSDSTEGNDTSVSCGNCHKLNMQDRNGNIKTEFNNGSKLDSYVKRSKTLRTFKDYYEMKFFRKSNSTLSAMGTGINLNFKNSVPLNEHISVEKPPLPPKQTKASEDALSLSEFSDSSESRKEPLAPSLPPKNRVTKSQSFAQNVILKSNRDGIAAPALPPKAKKITGRQGSRNFYNQQTPNSSQSFSENSDRPPNLPEKSSKVIKPHATNIKNNVKKYTTETDLDIAAQKCSKQNQDTTIDVPETLVNMNYYEDDSSFTISLGQSDSESISEKISKDFDEVDMLSTGSLGSHLQIEDNRDDLHMSDRISGEFILSTSRPTTLNRQKSQYNNGKLISVMENIIADFGSEVHGKSISSDHIKQELEKHLMNDIEADSVKRQWRKIIQIVESSANGKLCVKDLQKYINEISKENTKPKPDDSGYQSTDSSDSFKLLENSEKESTSKTEYRPSLKRNNSNSWRDNLKKNKHIQRSKSLQHIFPDSSNVISKDKYLYSSNIPSPTSLKNKVSPKLSVFFNDSFTMN